MQTGAPASEVLSRADAAWLHAEVPTNHFVVTSLALLDSPLNLERFKRMLSRRIGLHPRLRQVVSNPLLPLAPQRWTAAANFDLDAHIHRAALPEPRDMAALAGFIADLVGKPLDFGRPLWEIYVVEGPGDGGAFVSRFHHSLGDGQAMVKMLMALTDETPDGWKRPLPRPRRSNHTRRSGLGSLLAATVSMAGRLDEAPDAALQGIGFAGALARLTLMDGDRRTTLRGELSMLKQVAWSEPVPLDLIKEVAKASGTTVNDVVVSAIAGSIGAYLRKTGHDTSGLRIRAMVPVNLRPPDDTGMTGNQFSLIYLELPVGVANAWERLMRVKIEMDRIKASPEPAVGWLLIQSLGLLPAWLEHMMSGFYADKASMVLTNVMGPRQPIYSAGSRIRQMTFWEPESGGLGVGLSIFSYAGQLTVGAVSDRNLVADPSAITTGFVTAFSDLVRAAHVSTPRH
jgi:diacylglycerol O-acyltransferase